VKTGKKGERRRNRKTGYRKKSNGGKLKARKKRKVKAKRKKNTMQINNEAKIEEGC
jgi:hypothetical protein